MAVNKYPGRCGICGKNVPANGGVLKKEGKAWQVSHLACDAQQAPGVIEIKFSSGESIIQNKFGRCEDAPCCGCCTG